MARLMNHAYVPIEKAVEGGTLFRTSDGTVYRRDSVTGTIRREAKKTLRTKKQRRAARRRGQKHGDQQ